NGINTDRFNENNIIPERLEAIKENIKYNPANTYLLCMGRLVKDKGIVELINVFKALNQSSPSVKLILVGDFESSLDPLPEQTVAEIENNASIIHIHWTTEVEYYMHLADNFIFPSHREGFPNVLLQAGAMKLPIICSRIPGNIDIVKNNETGLTFKCQSEVELKNKIILALNEPKHIKKMANELYQIITKSYTRELFWQTMLSEYKKLI